MLYQNESIKRTQGINKSIHIIMCMNNSQHQIRMINFVEQKLAAKKGDQDTQVMKGHFCPDQPVENKLRFYC